jgi:hypothetical protein
MATARIKAKRPRSIAVLLSTFREIAYVEKDISSLASRRRFVFLRQYFPPWMSLLPH